jgi:hypothetical protein
MQHVEWIPKLKSNSLQLLYSIAEERAKQYRGYVRDVLPSITYVLNIADPTIPPKRQEHFTQQFLDRLLCHIDDPTTWENLNRFVIQQGLSVAALKRWRSYLDELKLSDKVSPSQDTKQETIAPPAQASVKTPPPAPTTPAAAVARRPTSSPAWLVYLKGRWDYSIATIQMGRFKNAAHIAQTWERYKTVLSLADFPEKKRAKIEVACRFVEACHVPDQQTSLALENTIVQLANQIDKLSLKCTPSQEDRIALAQRRLQAAGGNLSARSPSRPLTGYEVRLQGPQTKKKKN